MRLECSTDYALIASIMRHPRIYPWLGDDFYPCAEDFSPNESPAVTYLLAFDDGELLGVFMTHPINGVLWEVHHCLLPSAWGRRARAAGKAYLGWLWHSTHALKVVGFTPSDNALAIRFAKSLGLVEIGRLRRSLLRRGVLVDLVIVGKDKPLEEQQAWQA